MTHFVVHRTNILAVNEVSLGACGSMNFGSSDFEKEKAANLKVNLFFHFAKKLEHILQCTDYMHIDDTQLHLFCAHYVYLKLIV